MLVITFGRAASQELRERVREQLVAAERALSDPATVNPDDVLLTHLVSADVELRHKRISDALAGFDGATIATTHQFCQLVLRSLGVAGDTDSRAELVDNLDELVVEVTDDLYLRQYGSDAEPPPFKRAVALQLARAAVGDPQARARAERCRAGKHGAGQGRLRRVGARRGGAAQAPPRRPVVRRPAQPARRRARRRRRTCSRADAAALEGGPGRRVPGHRPGAVGRARPRLHRPRDADPDRRPEAGDLRLPRGRRRRLPARPPARPGPAGPWPPTGAATRPWSTPCRS